jgi:citrate lyase subunit beta/citryl-CoA lyase
MFDVPFLRRLDDLDELRARGSALVRMGASGLFALYPPHADVINALYTPNAERLEHARTVVEHFERAAERGEPAVLLPDGEVVLIHDYKKAKGILARASGRKG